MSEDGSLGERQVNDPSPALAKGSNMVWKGESQDFRRTPIGEAHGKANPFDHHHRSGLLGMALLALLLEDPRGVPKPFNGFEGDKPL